MRLGIVDELVGNAADAPSPARPERSGRRCTTSVKSEYTSSNHVPAFASSAVEPAATNRWRGVCSTAARHTSLRRMPRSARPSASALARSRHGVVVGDFTPSPQPAGPPSQRRTSRAASSACVLPVPVRHGLARHRIKHPHPDLDLSTRACQPWAVLEPISRLRAYWASHRWVRPVNSTPPTFRPTWNVTTVEFTAVKTGLAARLRPGPRLDEPDRCHRERELSPAHPGHADLGEHMPGGAELPVDTADGLLCPAGSGLPFCGDFGTTRELSGGGRCAGTPGLRRKPSVISFGTGCAVWGARSPSSPSRWAAG